MTQAAPQAPVFDPGHVPPLEQIDNLVRASSQHHGHLCPGQVIGVRMSILGLGLLGYACPLGYPEIKNVVGFVECERCLADAVASATGLRFGRGSLKMHNLGLLAATFMDLPTGRAVRLLSKESARDAACAYAPEVERAHDAQTQAYRVMPDGELFDVQWVRVNIDPNDLPGARPPKVPCEACGVPVRANKARQAGGRTLCAPCAGQAYFTPMERTL